MTLTDRENRIVDLTRALAIKMIERQVPEFALGYGFLWGYITIRRAQANGKVREFKVKECFGGVCVDDYRQATALAETLPGVSGCYINPD